MTSNSSNSHANCHRNPAGNRLLLIPRESDPRNLLGRMPSHRRRFLLHARLHAQVVGKVLVTLRNTTGRGFPRPFPHKIPAIVHPTNTKTPMKTPNSDPTSKLDTFAETMQQTARKNRPIFRSHKLASIGVMAAICIVLAQPSHRLSETQPESENALENPLFELSEEIGVKPRGIPLPCEIAWDEAFINPTRWNKLPAGKWGVESQTEKVIKYNSEEIREFMGGPARVVRIRCNAQTGAIQNIEVVWASNFYANYKKRLEFSDTPVVETKRESRSAQKARLANLRSGGESGREFTKAMEPAFQQLLKTMTEKFGSPEKTRMGKHKDIRVTAYDFKTPHGTTIRLFAHQTALIAYIRKSEEFHNRESVLDIHMIGIDREKMALDNVVCHPISRDTYINNIPMHISPCAPGSEAIIMEYWGAITSWDFIWARHFEFNATINALAPRNGVADDLYLEIRDLPLNMDNIAREIDAGRPMTVSRYTKPGRWQTHQAWAKLAETDPEFEIPEYERTRHAGWPFHREGGHQSVITGYNREKNVVLLTEPWGNEHRNYPITFEELKGTAFSCFAFKPKRTGGFRR